MSYSSDYSIMNRLQEHLDYALSIYKKDWFVLCAQGSMNYGLMDEESDVDSKLLIIPTLEDIVLNKKTISHTLEMSDNKEHVDVKDAREYFKIFRKSNINFVEILFTDYYIVNERYEDLWFDLKYNAELLARINPYAAVSCIKGMAHEKYHALDHEYPSRMPWIEKFGIDPKQMSHLLRCSYFLKWYIEGKPYKDCINLDNNEAIKQSLLECKRTAWGLSKEEIMTKAKEVLDDVDELADKFRALNKNENNPEAEYILNSTMYELIKRSLKGEILYG